MPAAFKEHLWRAAFVLAALFALTMAILPDPSLHHEVSDKWLHVLAFTVLTVLAVLAFPKAHALSILLGLSLLGGLIELIQAIPVLGRDASLADWMADILAVMLMLIVLRGLQGIWGSPDTSQNDKSLRMPEAAHADVDHSKSSYN